MGSGRRSCGIHRCDVTCLADMFTVSYCLLFSGAVDSTDSIGHEGYSSKCGRAHT